MRSSPSIVPADRLDRDIYLVLEDFGARAGCAWRETDERLVTGRHLREVSMFSSRRRCGAPVSNLEHQCGSARVNVSSIDLPFQGRD